MNKNEVKEILANINYPGFNRDIVSFGMVSGIEVKSDEVKIILSITSQNDEKKNILVSDIEKKLNEYF
jgi:ATP-binding protein involved in chromosome partitioning